MRRLFIGFDPGNNGGIVILNKYGELIAAIRMPTVTELTSKKTKKGKPGKTTMTDPVGINEFLNEHVRQTDRVFAAVEDVTTLQPPHSRDSNFKLGASKLACVSICVTRGYAVTLVPAVVWQENTFPHKGAKADKAKSISYARRKWPAMAKMLQNKDSDGPAEAGHIADYERRKVIGAL